MKKYILGKNRRRKRRTKRYRYTNILLQRLPNLRGVQLPNGRVFFAKHERVHRHSLAPNQVRIASTNIRKLGPRRKRIRLFGLRNERK